MVGLNHEYFVTSFEDAWLSRRLAIHSEGRGRFDLVIDLKGGRSKDTEKVD